MSRTVGVYTEDEDEMTAACECQYIYTNPKKSILYRPRLINSVRRRQEKSNFSQNGLESSTYSLENSLYNTRTTICSKISLEIDKIHEEKPRPRSSYRKSPMKVPVRARLKPKTDGHIVLHDFQKLSTRKLNIKQKRNLFLTPHRKTDGLFSEDDKKLQRYSLLKYIK